MTKYHAVEALVAKISRILHFNHFMRCLTLTMGFLQHLFTACCHHSNSISESPCKVAQKEDNSKTAVPTKGLLHSLEDIYLKCSASSSTSLSPTETTRKEDDHYQISKSSASLQNLLPLINLTSTADVRRPPPLSKLPDTLGEFECCQLLQNTLGLSEVQHLAEGFYSTVFTVRQPTDGQLYACKTFLFGRWSPHDRLFDFRRENFTTEAALLRRLSHEHIIKWFSSFQVYCRSQEEGGFQLSLESHESCNYEETLLLSGHLLQLVHLNLAQWMEHRQEGRRRLEGHQVRLMFDQIGSALQYLHSVHYTCHLDLKPANIGVQVTGPMEDLSRLILLDFGNSITYTQTEFELAERLSAESSSIDATVANCNAKTTNPFLLEAYHFSCLLMLAATFDVNWKSCQDIRDNFYQLQCNSAKTSQLDHLLLQMSTKNNHISINWAISWLAGKS